MNTNIKLPVDFYEELYWEIMNQNYYPTDEDDTSFGIEVELGNITVYLNVTFDVHVVDNSFDHAFGTKYIYDLEVGDLEGVEIEAIWFKDDDVDEDLTEQFDYEFFWEQFKQYTIRRNGIYIHNGDEVVVKLSKDWGAWEKMTFLYYDNRLDVAVCTRSIYSKYISKSECRFILPATTEYLQKCR